MQPTSGVNLRRVALVKLPEKKNLKNAVAWHILLLYISLHSLL